MQTSLLLASLENRFVTGSSISVFRFKRNSGPGYKLPVSGQYDDIEISCMQSLQNSNYVNNIFKTVYIFKIMIVFTVNIKSHLYM